MPVCYYSFWELSYALSLHSPLLRDSEQLEKKSWGKYRLASVDQLAMAVCVHQILNYFGIDAIEKQIADRHNKFKTRYSSSENVLCQSISKVCM